MEKREIEKQLNTAIQHAMSDGLREKVLKRCSEERVGTPFVINNVVDRKSKRKERVMSIVAAVAILFLACNVLFNLYEDSVKNRVDYVVDIDVNPSIELQINSKDRVVSVLPINADAQDILDGMELKGTQTKVAVNAIIGSMFEHGYLRGDTSKLLVSVDAKNSSDSESVQKAITSDINKILESYSSEASAIGQSITDDDTIEEIANKYGISNGKATLIQKIIACDSSYTADELSKLNITELYLIIYEINGLSVNNGEIIEGTDVAFSYNEVKYEKEDAVSSTFVMGNSVACSDTTAEKSDDVQNNKDAKKDKQKNKDKNHNPQSVSDNSVDKDKDSKDNDASNSESENSASDNGVSENSTSENSASANSASENSASENSASVNSASVNSASENSALENSALENSASKNQVKNDDDLVE